MLEGRELIILSGGARGKWKNHGLGGIWVFCVFFVFFILFYFLVFEFFFNKSNNLSSCFSDGDDTF